jgi:ATP-binding cassette subfamily F protein 3
VKLSPPLLRLSPEVTFGYDNSKIILNRVNFDVGLDTRIAVVGSNGASKYTLWVPPLVFPTDVLRVENRIKLLTGELNPISGQVNRKPTTCVVIYC